MGWILFLIGVIGWHAGMYLLFKKTQIAPWKALVPFYNTYEMVNAIRLPKYWFWLQFIPVVGQFISIWISIHFVMNFGRFSLVDHTLLVFLPFVYLPWLGMNPKVRWIGPEKVKLYEKSSIREWIDAAVFAIVAATIIRTAVFEAYTIPTESMEKTLLVGDFLFVNKLAYGPRMPITPLSFPFVHNTMPTSLTTPSYLKWIQLPYKRIPGYSKLERNDVVVFNFPLGDTIINLPDYGSKRPYYDELRSNYRGNREMLWSDFPMLVHPIDKTDNYIKRCTAIAGDTLQLINSVLYINGKPAFVPPGSQIDYAVKLKAPLSDDLVERVLELPSLSDATGQVEQFPAQPNMYLMNLTPGQLQKLKAEPVFDSASVYVQTMAMVTFPQEAGLNWSLDNYGPIVIPKKGVTVPLTAESIHFYRRLISVYENHTLVENGNQFIIDGKPATTYTFGQDYYWMMGDNRHRSQDSRYWGFVPETHIGGKASIIWFSYGPGKRANRIFKSIE